MKLHCKAEKSLQWGILYLSEKSCQINISETKVKHYANNGIVFSYHQIKNRNKSQMLQRHFPDILYLKIK